MCRSTQWSCVKCCSRAVLEASSMAFPRRCCGLLLNLPPFSRLFGVDKRSVSTCSCLVSLLFCICSSFILATGCCFKRQELTSTRFSEEATFEGLERLCLSAESTHPSVAWSVEAANPDIVSLLSSWWCCFTNVFAGLECLRLRLVATGPSPSFDSAWSRDYL